MENKNLIRKNPALILVDIQKAFLEKDYPGINRNNHDEEFICGMEEQWRMPHVRLS